MMIAFMSEHSPPESCAGLVGGSRQLAVGGSILPSAGFGRKYEFALLAKELIERLKIWGFI